jgi:hypothetical protein
MTHARVLPAPRQPLSHNSIFSFPFPPPLPLSRLARSFFPQYLYPYLSNVDGMFILQSLYDTANLGICFQMGCNLYTSCNAAEVAAIDQYHLDLLHEVQGAVGNFPARDGVFLTSCYQHEESCRFRDWFGITIRGGTPNSTFFTWYTQGASAEGSSQVDGPWPSDASCAPQGFDHGAC